MYEPNVAWICVACGEEIEPDAVVEMNVMDDQERPCIKFLHEVCYDAFFDSIWRPGL